MNNRAISSMMMKHVSLRKILVGVYPADMLPKTHRKQKPAAYIVNTKGRNHRGEHWVVIYDPGNKAIEFFDTFGREPQKEFQTFLGDNYIYSDKIIQHPFTSVCGQYCCFYILKRSEGLDMCDILSMFSEDHLYNDILVNRVIEKTFSIDLDVVDIQQSKQHTFEY